MSECAEYLVALTEESSDVLPEKQKELVLRRNESTRVEVKIGPASLNSLYHAQTPRAMIRTYMKFPRRLAVMSEVVGPDLLCPNDLHFLSLGTGRAIAWHRDSWSFSRIYVISAGNSIEESSITNGWRGIMRMLK